MIKFFRKHAKPWFDINKIDTTWIGDLNAPTSLALYRYYDHGQRAVNKLRRVWHKSIIKNGKKLVNEIEQELKDKNQ